MFSFRVNGPKIHRKMDLAQFPVLPRGSPDDPLADPYDVPTYSFKFRTFEHTRAEDSDAAGRVRGWSLLTMFHVSRLFLIWLLSI